MKRATSSLLAVTLGIGVVYAGACSSSGSSMGSTMSGPTPGIDMSTSPPSPDPRVGLAAGTMVKYSKDTTKRVMDKKAGEAYWNMRILANRPPAEPFVGVTHSDLAFTGNYVIQGNYDGYQIWDVSNPRDPKLYDEYVCRGSQSDVSVYKNLIFVSGEAPSGRLDCGTIGVSDSVSKERLRGIRIFDATDLKHPKYIGNVQTCRGRTRTPSSKIRKTRTTSTSTSRVHQACVRRASSPVAPTWHRARIRTASCSGSKSSAFRWLIRNNPSSLSKPGILADLGRQPSSIGRTKADSIDNAARAAAAGRGGAGGRGGRPAPNPNIPPGPQQCHDITVYPSAGFAGGACGGYGLLLDISDVPNPKRLYAAADSNMSFWHSATFNNDATQVLFSDEWGGGSAPRCRSTDKMEWGADALFTISADKKLTFKSYYKMPAAQTRFENCVAHNGSLIPIPGRDVMVQAFYQGGITVFDWTDPSHPKEIAFMDRGPIDTLGAGANAGSWSAYWYNGIIVSSEIGRGLDVFELQPSAFISKNELDAAKSSHYEYLNVQGQQKMTWPATFSLSRAYLDQLARTNGQTSERIAFARNGLDAAEKLSGKARQDALTALATQLHTDARTATDAAKAHKLAFSVGDLAKL